MADDSGNSAEVHSMPDDAAKDPKVDVAGSSVTETAERANSAAATQSRAHDWKTSAIVQIAAAVIAVAGSYAGAQIAYQGSQEAVEKQVDADSRKSEREKRSDIYLAFLEASNKYAGKIGGIYEACSVIPERGDYSSVQPVALCIVRSPDFDSIRTPLHTGRNMLYIYGSAEANRVADEIMAKLPASEIPFPRKIDFESFDIEDFREKYKSLQTIACVELPPNPRGDC